jgi:hypothetical protein
MNSMPSATMHTSAMHSFPAPANGRPQIPEMLLSTSRADDRMIGAIGQGTLRPGFSIPELARSPPAPENVGNTAQPPTYNMAQPRGFGQSS